MLAAARNPRERLSMGTVVIRIPLVTWRDGRPRFFPGPAARALGFKGEDLRHGPSGPWFTLDEAIAWSAARQAEISARRDTHGRQAPEPAGKKPRLPTADCRLPRHAGHTTTVGHVISAFLASPRMAGREIVEGRRRRPALARATARAYRGSARLLERFDGGRVWAAPAAELTGKALTGILHRVEVAHGLAQARALRAFLSVAFRHGRAAGSVAHNPVADLEEALPVLAPDVRPATVEEVETFVAACDALGFPDVADVFLAGPWTGQRQNDRLALTAAQISADGILFRPSKKSRTRDALLIPLAAALARRLEAAEIRRRGWKVRPLPGGPVFLCERTGRPWQADWYRKVARVLRHAAAFGRLETDAHGKPTREAVMLLGGVDVAAALARAGVTPLPSLADLEDKHGRDTCLSWLALAGADKWQIAGFSGHAFGQSDRVLKHYVAIPPEFARAGMARLEAWYAARSASGKKEAGK